MSGMKPPGQEDREKLPAEITFDKRVYGGISYFAQAAAGIVLCHWLTHGKGKKYFDPVVEKVGSILFKSKPVEEATKAAVRPTIVTTMIAVGTTFLIPVKWLENFKPQIVRGMHNKRIAKQEAKGIVQTPEEKAHDEKCLEQLDKEPKQTWSSLGWGRAFSLAFVYAAVFGFPKTNETIENVGIKYLLKGTEKAGLKSLANNKTLSEYLHIGFLDVFYSAISAGGLYVYSHFVRPPKKGEEADIARIADSEALTSPITPLLVEAERLSEQHPKPSINTTQDAEQNVSKGNLFQHRIDKPKDRPQPALQGTHLQKLVAEDLKEDFQTWDRATV